MADRPNKGSQFDVLFLGCMLDHLDMWTPYRYVTENISELIASQFKTMANQEVSFDERRLSFTTLIPLLDRASRTLVCLAIDADNARWFLPLINLFLKGMGQFFHSYSGAVPLELVKYGVLALPRVATLLQRSPSKNQDRCGIVRLLCVRFISELFSHSLSPQQMQDARESGVLPLCLELFFEHKLSSILHCEVSSIVQKIVKRDMEPLTRQLIEEIDFPAKILSSIIENKFQQSHLEYQAHLSGKEIGRFCF